MTAATNVESTDALRHNDGGTALVMAMIFLTVGALLVVSLARFATANMAQSNSLITTRVMNYTADGALDGAIQWVRYHPDPANCPAAPGAATFPTTGSLHLSNGEYAVVSCTNVSSGLITAEATGAQLTVPSSNFPTNPDYAISNQPVTGPGIPDGTTVTAVNTTGTSATMSYTLPPGTTVTVTVGADGLTLDDFSACVGSGPITSCSNPVSTAAVLFNSTVPSSSQCDGVPVTVPLVAGCNASVLRWTLKDANS